MKISKSSDYALVLLAGVAKEPPEKWVSIRLFAENVGLSPSFLSNIVHKLVQKGILESQRGVHGGVRLAKPKEEISIGAVLQAMDDPLVIVECMETGSECPIAKCCDIKEFWSVTHSLILASLKSITLADIHHYLKNHRKGILTHEITA